MGLCKKEIGKIIKKKEKDVDILPMILYMKENGNDKKEGRGICYYINGDKEMGDYANDKKIGRHVTLKVNGDITTNNYNN